MKFLKRLLVLFLAIFTFVVTIDAFNIPVNAAITTFGNIFTNPGEDSNTMMNIVYQLPLTAKNSRVEYTLKSDTSWANKKTALPKEELNDAFTQLNAIGESFIKCNVNLTDLTPGTEYMYRVKYDSNESDVRYFKTGDNYFSFIWVSDFHTYYSSQTRIKAAESAVNKALETNGGSADFVFTTGDTIAHGGTYEWWQQLSDISFTKNFMFADTLGNHDWMTKTGTTTDKGASHIFWGANHNNPTNGYGNQNNICYYFFYGDALFICLNTEEFTQAQYDWCEEVLKSNDAQYKFIFQHYQMFGGSGSANSTGYKRWHELCDKYGVDVAFSGNSHVYLRTKSIYQDAVSTNPNQGTVYMVAPSSDGERGEELPKITNNVSWIEKNWANSKAKAASVVNVTEDGIHVRLVDNTGTILDEATIAAKRGPTRVTKNLDGVDKDAIMNAFDFKVEGNDYANPILSYADNASEAVRSIKVSNEENGEVYCTKALSSSATQIAITNLPQYKKMKLVFDVTFYDNESRQFKKDYMSGADYGKFENLKIDSQTDTGALLKWDDTLKESEINAIQIKINDREIAKLEVGTHQYEIPFTRFKAGEANSIIFNVLSKSNNIYETMQLTYNAPIIATSVEIDCEGEEEIFALEETKLVYTVTPNNAIDKFIWTSDDESVAVVKEDGTIVGIDEGVAVITCSSKVNPRIKSDFIITVLGGVNDKLVIKTPEGGKNLSVGAEINLVPRTVLVGDTFMWETSDSSVATVDENGVVKTLKNGKVTITCTSVEHPEYSASIALQVGEESNALLIIAIIGGAIILLGGAACAFILIRKKQSRKNA